MYKGFCSVFISKQMFSNRRWKVSLVGMDSKSIVIIKVMQHLTFFRKIKSVESDCVCTSPVKILDTRVILDVEKAVFFYEVLLPIVCPTNQIAPLIM